MSSFCISYKFVPISHCSSSFGTTSSIACTNFRTIVASAKFEHIDPKAYLCPCSPTRRRRTRTNFTIATTKSSKALQNHLHQSPKRTISLTAIDSSTIGPTTTNGRKNFSNILIINLKKHLVIDNIQFVLYTRLFLQCA